MNRSPAEPRVLVVPASYFARDRTIGGGERYALEYARALSRLTPTTLSLFDTVAGTERVGDLEIRRFTVEHFKQRWRFPFTPESRRAMREFEVFHAMVFPTPLTDALILTARFHGKTAVLTDVGGGGACWSTYLTRLHPRLNLNRLAHGLASLSRHGASFFRDWPQPQTILYGGVNLDQFKPATGPPAGYALFAGRLLRHKGVLQIIEAIDSKTPLHVVGRPYDQTYLRQLRQAAEGKTVQFILDAGDDELLRQYAGANVVLQPSLPSDDPAGDKSELLGLVTLEAMATARPVIVTRVASLPELVIDRETGFIIEPHDPVALREKISLLIENPALALTMGHAARRHIENHFTWDKVAGRGMDLYRQLSHGNSARTQS
jgi:glycosyltransferase involved in cell wall biosynthesis